MKSDQKEPEGYPHHTAKLLMKTMRLQQALMESRVRRTGVYRSQHQILMYIASNPDASQKDIARMHQVSTATIAVSLKKLEKAGYICRVMDQEDNRCNRLQITEKGQQVVEQSRRIFQQVEEEMYAGFCEADYQCLEGLLDRICGNVQQSLKGMGRSRP